MLRLIYFVNTLEIFRSLPSQAACDVITSLLDMVAISHTCESSNVVVASQLSTLPWLWLLQFATSLFLDSSGSAAVFQLQQPKPNLTWSIQTVYRVLQKSNCVKYLVQRWKVQSNFSLFTGSPGVDLKVGKFPVKQKTDCESICSLWDELKISKLNKTALAGFFSLKCRWQTPVFRDNG